jgi:hypothetical protein
MQVLGELISLDQTDRLALPWWHRACLGFITNTSVYVAAVWNDAGRPPDLIVTVFNPRKWNNLYRVMAQQRDKPGILAQHFQSVSPHNIAVAESATIGNGAVYHNNMYIEDTKILTPAAFTNDLNDAFGEKSFFEFSDIPMSQQTLRREDSTLHGHVTTFLSELGYPPKKYLYIDYVQVKEGWVDVTWKQQLANWMDAQSIRYDEFDLTKAVLSADTSSRILRFVFPRRDAKSIIVPHSDSPGEAGRICKIITEDGSNLLSATIRRVRAGQQAELVVVCEPPEAYKGKDYEKELRSRLEPDFPRTVIRSGRRAQHTITPLRKFERTIVVPTDFQPAVKTIWSSALKRRQRLIFLSRRAALQFHEELVGAVKSTLEQLQFQIIESNVQHTHGQLTPADVQAKLWASEGGIVIIGPVERSDSEKPDEANKSMEPLWINVTHEIGHMQGQGKPLLFLVNRNVGAPFANMPNLQGTHYVEYGTLADRLGSRGQQEIQALVRTWIEDNFSDEQH